MVSKGKKKDHEEVEYAVKTEYDCLDGIELWYISSD